MTDAAAGGRLVVGLAAATTTELDELQAIELASFGVATARLHEEIKHPWARIWTARLAVGATAARPATATVQHADATAQHADATAQHADATAAPAVGYLLAWHVADELHVLSIATSPNERRRGIGRALLDAALAYARTSAIELVLLEVRKSNDAALALYESAGFVISGVRARYYADTGEDAIEMALTLGADSPPAASRV